MIDPREAWRRLEPHLKPLPATTVPRRDAGGRVLARALAATVDVPAQDVSAMDGFVLTGEPPAGPGAEAELPVAGVIAAGDAPGAALAPATALRIMTGAPVPPEGERVIPVEQAVVRQTGEGGEAVRFEDPGRPGGHIRRRGEVIRAGAEVLPSGALLTPGGLSVAATHGYAELTVHRPPRVALIVTGDEVVPPEAEPGPGQLRDSHTDFVLAACADLGVPVEPLGIAPDDPDRLREMVERGLGADVLLLSGGVSMGEFDLVADVLAAAGCETLFHRVAIQPGKPLLAGRHDGGPDGRGLVFGLPGNPASVMVCFWLFVRPALRRLMGRPGAFWQGTLTGELTAPLPRAKARERFVQARLAAEGDRLLVSPVLPVGSHDPGAYALGEALARIPANCPGLDAGDPCDVLPLPGAFS